jgi:hypothetical protein
MEGAHNLLSFAFSAAKKGKASAQFTPRIELWLLK